MMGEDIKKFRQQLDEFRRVVGRTDPESIKKAQELDWDLMRGNLTKECAELGVYLFDADCWLESADEHIEACEGVEERELVLDEVDNAVRKLGEAETYFDLSHSYKYISDEEYKEVKERLKLVHKALGKGEWEEARTKLGDTDKLAKRLLFNKLIQCECGKR